MPFVTDCHIMENIDVEATSFIQDLSSEHPVFLLTSGYPKCMSQILQSSGMLKRLSYQAMMKHSYFFFHMDIFIQDLTLDMYQTH